MVSRDAPALKRAWNNVPTELSLLQAHSPQTGPDSIEKEVLRTQAQMRNPGERERENTFSDLKTTQVCVLACPHFRVLASYFSVRKETDVAPIHP